MSGEFLELAKEYVARGWCILPMTVDRQGNKKPALKTYKRYHSERPTAETLASWFSSTKVDGMNLCGLGVMCGSVSGGLYCRDFDILESYLAWAAEHVALAKTLPTVKTARAFHVYGRQAALVKTLDFEDGELRGEKAFVVLPPSDHPSGVRYAWVNPLPMGEISLISPEAAGLNVCMLQRGQRDRRETEKTENTQKQNGHVSLCLSVSLSYDERVNAAIMETLPTRAGTRDDNVFTLARALKAIPELADLPAGDLRDIVKRWHSLALSVIGTKPFDVTWAAFCHAWPRVEFPLGTSPLESIMETLVTKVPPPEAGAYETQGVKMLVALCAELQRRAGDKPFYLDCRSAGRCIGTDHNIANNWLNMLTADRLLTKIEQGRPGHASRWRWNGI
jgi:Bifunctional DNA primase/polymerase, N-terminal